MKQIDIDMLTEIGKNPGICFPCLKIILKGIDFQKVKTEPCKDDDHMIREIK